MGEQTSVFLFCFPPTFIDTRSKMAATFTATSCPVLPKRSISAKKNATARTVCKRVAVCKPVAKLDVNKAAPVASVAASIAAMIPAEHANAAQEVADLALGLSTNKTGSIATALFIFLPVCFLVGLFVKSDSEGNVAGGFSQSYYDASKKRKEGGKETNDAAKFKGEGKGMYS